MDHDRKDARHRVELLDSADRVHRLVDEFITRQSREPHRAWESLIQLKEVLEQLQRLYPARAFRTEPKRLLT